jgi:predicted NAD/FAD-binding protein
MRIAIVGSGIAGMGAAWALYREHEIVLYEKEPRIGGHSHTVDVDYDGTPIAVDTGFIVYNELNYPNLTALFRHLDVAARSSGRATPSVRSSRKSAMSCGPHSIECGSTCCASGATRSSI